MTQNQPLFSQRDRRLIEALTFDPSLEPMFNDLADYFIWFDELPDNITPDKLSQKDSEYFQECLANENRW